VDDSPLENRTVVITGAARGVGAALAAALAGRGARLALLDHDGAALRATAAALPAATVALRVDVTDNEALHDDAEVVRERLGPPSAVVANAGVAEAGLFALSDAATWRRVVEVNLVGSAQTARAFLPDLIRTAGCWRAMFDQVMARIAGRFGRVEPRATARSYLLGLLSATERKNCWQLAEQAARPGLPDRPRRRRDSHPAGRPAPSRPQPRPDHAECPRDPPPARRRLRRTGHDCRQTAALVHLAKTPPGRSPTQPLPTAVRRRTCWIDHKTALEY
jgi:hypothetical protein